MTFKIALLDVDRTLMFDGDVINEQLLNYLRDKQVTQVYLFTDMTYRQSVMQDRARLVSALTASGFVVLGVITPQDLLPPLPENELLLHEQYRGNYRADDPAFEQWVTDNQNALPQTFQSLDVNTYQSRAQSLTPGHAYETARTRGYSPAVESESNIAKAIADRLAFKMGFRHTKGLLFDLFLRHRNYHCQQLFVADDDETVLAALQGFRPVSANTVVPTTHILQITQGSIKTRLMPTGRRWFASSMTEMIGKHRRAVSDSSSQGAQP